MPWDRASRRTGKKGLREAIAASCVAAGLAASISGLPGSEARARQSGAADRCATLADLALPGVEIDSARLIPGVAPGTMPFNPSRQATIPIAMPDYCRVEGTIDRRKGADGIEYGIGFALALPGNWQGRLLFQGGGGFNGSVREPYGSSPDPRDPALAKGFAVVSTDSGHKGAIFDVGFMCDQQASLDFAFNALPAVTLAAKQIATAYFGRAPHHTYSVGCSTGGHEGMLAAQRYPMLFRPGCPAMLGEQECIVPERWTGEYPQGRIRRRDRQPEQTGLH